MDLEVANVEECKAIFLFSDNTYLGRSMVAEDRLAIIRLLALYKRLDRRMDHIYVQMNQKSSKLLAKNLGAHSVVCLTELKMKMLAKS